ncbi:MAG: hypothetical protein ABFE08_23920 [Armatimonadia bacterium]
MDDELQLPDKEVFEDPRELPRTGATILRLKSGRLDLEVFTRVFVNQLKLIKSEATKLCQQESGILVDNIDPKLAEALAGELRSLGEECVVVPAADLMMLPRPYPVHAVRLTRSGLSVRGTGEDWVQLAWDELAVLALGQVTFEEQTTRSTDSLLTRRITPISAMGGVGGAVGAAMAVSGAMQGRTTTTKSSQLRQLLDLVSDGGQQYYRIDGRHFDYSILGDQIGHSSTANILTFSRWLLSYSLKAWTNIDSKQLQQTGTCPIPSHSLHGLSDIAKWLLNLRKLGCPQTP